MIVGSVLQTIFVSDIILLLIIIIKRIIHGHVNGDYHAISSHCLNVTFPELSFYVRDHRGPSYISVKHHRVESDWVFPLSSSVNSTGSKKKKPSALDLHPLMSGPFISSSWCTQYVPGKIYAFLPQPETYKEQGKNGMEECLASAKDCLKHHVIHKPHTTARETTIVHCSIVFFLFTLHKLLATLVMAPIDAFLSLICVAAIIFNLRLLLACFIDKKKNIFLHNSKSVVILQLIAHIVLLTTYVVASFEAKPIYLRKEYCSIFKILQVSLEWFIIFNLASLLLIAYQPCIYGKQQISPTMAFSVALLAGFLSLINTFVSLSDCFPGNFSFAFRLSLLALTAIFPVGILLVLTGKICGLRIDSTEKSPTPRYLCIESKTTKTTVFLCIIYLLLLSSITVLQVIVSSPRLHKEFQDAEYLKEVLCFFSKQFAIGLALPLTLKQVADTSGLAAENI